ncbi:hypothetical protein ACEWY4_025035 [Coilia grayii]|uniref:Uncharacterized protein n=1 Tax=Coilia grayii TaxID=363190 RepID=A0ABD1IY76_9TELE
MDNHIRKRQPIRLPTNTERVQRARPLEGYICEDYDPMEEIKTMVETYNEEKKKRVMFCRMLSTYGYDFMTKIFRADDRSAE